METFKLSVRKKKINNYSKDDLQNAVEAVKNKSMNTRKASLFYKIPYSTIKLNTIGLKNQKIPMKTTKGPMTVLSRDVEEELSSHIKTMGKWGFGLTKKEIIFAVARYVEENLIKNNFKNGVPGNKWFHGFKKRWNLSSKIGQSLELARVKQQKPETIYGFFDLLQDTINELKLTDKPGQIFNCDETSFCHDPKRQKIVVEKGSKAALNTSGNGRENTSVLFCVSASGQKLPPLIIFKSKLLWNSWMSNNAYPDTSYGSSENGWMTSDLFYDWMKNCFLKKIKEKPALLIFDGHASHVGIKVIKLAKENDVTLLLLPSHTTHILQPLDVGVFGPFKTIWDEDILFWQRQHYGLILGKSDFSELLGKTWSKVKTTAITSGFSKTGIFENDEKAFYPVQPSKIPESIFDPKDLKNFKIKNGILEDEIDLNLSVLSSTSSVLSSTSTVTSPKCNFEQILLENINLGNRPKVTRRKVSSSSKVLTKDTYIKELEEQSKNKENNKRKRVKKV